VEARAPPPAPPEPPPPPRWAGLGAVAVPAGAWHPGRVAAKTNSNTVECDGESWEFIANYRKRLTTFSYYVSDYY